MSAVKRLTANDAPGERLGDEPVIESEAQANLALRELAFMAAHRSSASHACDEMIRALRDEVAAELESYCERDAVLQAALKRYVETEHRQLKSGKGPKSIELRHGVLGWQKSRDAVAYCKGQSHPKAIELIDQATSQIKGNSGGMLARLGELAGSIRLFSRDSKARMLSLFVDLKPTINLTKARKAVEEKAITPGQLKTFGMDYQRGEDVFYAEPATYEV